MAEQANSTPMPSRRAFFGSAVASGIAAAGPPIFTVPAVATSLAAACVWATQREVDMEDNVITADWDDDRWEGEIDRCGDVYQRAIAEPSGSMADLTAKARLALADLRRGERFGEGDTLDQLSYAIVRELAAMA